MGIPYESGLTRFGITYHHTALVLKSELTAGTVVLLPLSAPSGFTLAVDGSQNVTVTSTVTGAAVASRVVVVPFDASTH
ncbi:hypothetical protein GCM10011505_39200 [Tistrella bauzanensis]|uniref:Uncharacterized protein n=1 Tax=Tistrella bauzanensis TaxID=657419 RepID=A0ABQ1IWP7_9PROT|nr:hypothetical protein GCM10011505_39200 [Tistrella bauzanensis]